MITGMPRIAIAVHDFEKCVATFGEDLGMPVIDVSASSVANLGAKLCGNYCKRNTEVSHRWLLLVGDL